MSGESTGQGSVDEQVRRSFEAAWMQGQPRPIEQFLPAGEDEAKRLATLEELVHIELEFAWRAWGKQHGHTAQTVSEDTLVRPALVESYLSRFEALNKPDIVLRLVQTEFYVRSRYGDRPSPMDYRARFADQQWLDQTLRSSLLMFSELADAARPARHTDNSAGIEGSDFGDYELVEEIGRGGMGVVYRARQRSADRDVALKVIRRDWLGALPSASQSEVIGRFRTEAQAAAKLEHENIITVYEVGELQGQQFYSMRYVDGRSLADILRGGPLEPRRAAAYMEAVARAVYEAHSAGILHRDLKPQNIMVDGKTDRAMVADFGLAKRVEGSEELTVAGEVIGTPSYMSPEQARDSAHVTAKTDIYALGATLYHLLTSRPPFQAATPVETLRQVIDDEPVPPSRLNRAIDRDLETICLKCLEKESARRYNSTKLLADDLRRYLHREPIAARPIGKLERSVRWCRRNPAISCLLATAGTFLIMMFVVGTIGYVNTIAALEKSEESFRQARETVDYFYTEVSQNVLLNQPGMQPLRDSLLDRARQYYERFSRERSGDDSLRAELGLAYFRVGQIKEKIQGARTALNSYRQADAIQTELVARNPHDANLSRAHGDTLNAIGNVGLILNRLDDAHEALTKALTLRKKIAGDNRDRTDDLRTLANTYMNLGLVAKARADLTEARRMFERAQRYRSDLLDADADNTRVRRDRAMGYYNLGALAFAAVDPDEVELEAAAQYLQEAVADFQRLVRREPENLANQLRLATCLRVLGDLHSVLADKLEVTAEETAAQDPQKTQELHDRAEDGRRQSFLSFEQSLQTIEPLATQNPRVLDYQMERAAVHISLGRVAYGRGDFDQAAASFQRSMHILTPLITKQASCRRDFALTARQLALAQIPAGQVQAAKENLELSRQHFQTLTQDFPQDEDYQSNLQLTLALIKELANSSQDEEQAE